MYYRGEDKVSGYAYILSEFPWFPTPPTVLHEILEHLKVERGVQTLTELTKDLHIYPDFHGK